MDTDWPTTFAEWLSTAKPGDIYVYLTGFLADRITPVSDHERAEANAALEAFCMGKVELVQKRIKLGVDKAPGTFQYIAQKRRVIEKPTVLGTPWMAKLRGSYAGWGVP